jgi:hypothetical protein
MAADRARMPSYAVGYSTTKGPVSRAFQSVLYLVGVTGFEPATSSSRTKRATKLRHTPVSERSLSDEPPLV